jgi:LEA14-like dessication related protein
MHQRLVAAIVAAPVLFTACASAPVVPMPPVVEVSQFGATVITPETIDFVGKVRIHNQMRGPLEIEKVDYEFALHDNPLREDTFAKLHPMSARGTQTVTLPFRIAMKDVANQVEDVLAEEGVRVTMRGTVTPVGFAPIAFTATRVIPLPRVPFVQITSVRGNPLDGAFTIWLQLQNTNDFPLEFGSIETYLRLNGKKYELLRGESFRSVPAGGSGRIALTMQKTRGKGLSMLVNMARNHSADFTVGGTLCCQTPHGLFCLPVELNSSAAAPGR